MDFIYEPWPWYVSGPLIALIMLTLILMGKKFGMSSNFRTLCSACGADKCAPFFQFEWKKDIWNLWVLLGLVLGGYLGSHLNNSNQINLNEKTVNELHKIGLSATDGYAPNEIIGKGVDLDWNTVFILAVGGLLIGFGSRYAGGCTSGHAISGLSNLQIPSLIAVIGFFVGGLICTHFLLPNLF